MLDRIQILPEEFRDGHQNEAQDGELETSASVAEVFIAQAVGCKQITTNLKRKNNK